MELTAKPTAVPARPGHFPYPGSVPLPFIIIAHGAMGARPWGGGRSPMGRWAFAHGAVGDGNLRDRNGNQGRGNANQGPRITNQGRKTEGEG